MDEWCLSPLAVCELNCRLDTPLFFRSFPEGKTALSGNDGQTKACNTSTIFIPITAFARCACPEELALILFYITEQLKVTGLA